MTSGYAIGSNAHIKEMCERIRVKKGLKPTPFSLLGLEAQSAIVDAACGIEVTGLSEKVKDEIRQWAMLQEGEGE